MVYIIAILYPKFTEIQKMQKILYPKSTLGDCPDAPWEAAKLLFHSYWKINWDHYCWTWLILMFCLNTLWGKNWYRLFKTGFKLSYIDKSRISDIWVWKTVYFFQYSFLLKKIISTLIQTHCYQFRCCIWQQYSNYLFDKKNLVVEK